MSSRIAPYSAVYHLTSPCSSSFSAEKEQYEKLSSTHLAFSDLLRHDRQRIWKSIQRQIRDLPIGRMEFSAWWPSKIDFAFHSAKTRAGIILCTMDLIAMRFENQSELKGKIIDIIRGLDQIKAFRIFRAGEYHQKDGRLKNIIYAWLWVKS